MTHQPRRSKSARFPWRCGCGTRQYAQSDVCDTCADTYPGELGFVEECSHTDDQTHDGSWCGFCDPWLDGDRGAGGWTPT